MAILNQKRILNLIPKVSAPVTIHVSQGDVGTEIEFTLVKGDEVFSDTGNLTASVHGVREDGANFGPFTCTLSGSKVTFPLHSEMTAVKGSALAEIVLVDNGGNKVGSANFGILVEESVFPLGVTYDNDVSVYESILNYVQSGMAQAISLYNSLQEQFEQVISGVTVDSEVIDARLGADGVNYTTLGNAIRNQFSDIDAAIYNVENQSNMVDYGRAFGYETGRLLNDGTVDSSVTNFVTIKDFIPYTTDEFLIFEKIGSTTSVTIDRAVYDSDKNLINFNSESKTFPNFEAGTHAYANAAFLKFSFSINTMHHLSIYKGVNGYKMLDFNTKHLQSALSDESKKYIDYFVQDGVTFGLLNDDGTITPNLNFITTDFVPVDFMHSLCLRSEAQRYTLKRATYDENKALIAYVSINVTDYNRNYRPDSDAVKYVRYCLSYAVGRRCSLYNKLQAYNNDELYDAFSFETINETLPCHNYSKDFGWVAGILSTSDGTVTNNSTWCTIGGFIPLDVNETLQITVVGASGYTLRQALYDENYNFISGTSINVTGETRGLSGRTDAKYVKYCISQSIFGSHTVHLYKVNRVNGKCLQSVVEQFECTNYSYSGDIIDMTPEHGVTITREYNDNGNIVMPSGVTSAQGFAVHNNYLFQLFADDYCMVFDLNNHFAKVAEFALTCGHGNTASFGGYYASTDEFPLLYCSANGHVYVHRIVNFTATQVQELKIDNPAIYGYHPMLAIDVINNIGWTYANPVDETYMSSALICKLDLNNLTDNGDGTVTPALLDSFTVALGDNLVVNQGTKYFNGRLFHASGAYNANVVPKIFVIDLTSKAVTSVLDNLPQPATYNELEDIAIVDSPFKNKKDILMYIRGAAYYRVKI